MVHRFILFLLHTPVVRQMASSDTGVMLPIVFENPDRRVRGPTGYRSEGKSKLLARESDLYAFLAGLKRKMRDFGFAWRDRMDLHIELIKNRDDSELQVTRARELHNNRMVAIQVCRGGMQFWYRATCGGPNKRVGWVLVLDGALVKGVLSATGLEVVTCAYHLSPISCFGFLCIFRTKTPTGLSEGRFASNSRRSPTATRSTAQSPFCRLTRVRWLRCCVRREKRCDSLRHVRAADQCFASSDRSDEMIELALEAAAEFTDKQDGGSKGDSSSSSSSSSAES